MPIRCTKTVFPYFYPEVARIAKLRLPQELFLQTTPIWEVQALAPISDLRLPSTDGATFDHEEVHNPIIDRIVEQYRDVLPGLDGFAFRYQVPGSSPGIYQIMGKLRDQGVTEINCIKGEYEGYEQYGLDLGISVHYVDSWEEAKSERGVWFISNPSAVDGNVVPNDVIRDICENGSKVLLDFAYLGTTYFYPIDVSHPNVFAVVSSFSKPYGFFRMRVGFVYLREESASLWMNRWFKDLTRSFQALMLAEKVGPRLLKSLYARKQKEIVDSLNREFGLPLAPSDTLLLAHCYDGDLDERQRGLLSAYRRADSYRLCLTPYYETLELNG